MKKHVIRKNAFHYSDDSLYFHTTGVVVGGIYEDYNKAEKDFIELEREEYLSTDLGDTEPFAGCNNEDKDMMVRLKKYFDEQLNLKNILVQDEHGLIYAERDTYLPENITNEQIDRIRSLSGLNFHELHTFEEEVQFFGIWKKKPFYDTEGLSKHGESAYFFNSYIEAFNSAIKYFPYDFEKGEIIGAIDELTDTPIILRSLISSSSSIKYDDKKLTFGRLYDKEWASLCTLLKVKPFEIRVLTFEDVQSYNQYDYEEM